MALALWAILLIGAPTLAEGPTVGEVERELMCQCGCNLVLAGCGMMGCGVAEEMRAEIRQMIDAGMSKQEILGYYVARYGEKVLSAPTKRGFNLVAWVTPFAAVIGGGGLLYFILRAWARRGRADEEPVPPPFASEEESEAYRERFEEEFERFEQEDR